jgi:hypothetical protein
VKDPAQLAAALADAGEVEAAADIAVAAVEGAEDAAARIIALDIAVGTCLSTGRIAEARTLLAHLEAAPLAGAALAAAFRQAQLARLDGDLRRATALWRSLVARLAPHPAAAGALAASWMELGETMVLRWSLRAVGVSWFAGSDDGEEVEQAEAEACFTAAGQAWARANRRAGLFRAEAWKLRVRAQQPTISSAVDTAVGYARERGLVGMAAELLCLRAVIRGAPLDALHAVEMLPQTPLARGRARVIAAELGAPLDSVACLAELSADAPWLARARLLLGARSES